MAKKVLVFTSLNKWDDIRIFKKEVNTLKQKFEVTLLATSNEDENFIYEGVKVKTFKRPQGIKQRLKNLKFIFEKSKEEEYDYYHFHNPELLLLAPFIKLVNKNAKIIYDMHEDFEAAIMDKYWIPSYLRRVSSISYKVMLYLSMKFFLNKTIVTTPLIEKKFKGENVAVIENYAPLYNEIEAQVPEHINEIIKCDTGNFKVIFTGLINEHRGVLNVIKAVLELNNVSLYLVGVYPNEFKDQFNDLKKLDSGNKIHLFDSIKYDEMLAVMEKMDVGILPYLPTGNHMVTRPNKLFEYMLAHLPVISSDFPLYKEVVDQGCGVKIDPTSIDSIKQAINFLASNPEKAKEMGYIGNELYKRKYNWEIEGERLLDIYNNIQR